MRMNRLKFTQICDMSHKSRHGIDSIRLVYVLTCVTRHVTCMNESCHAYQYVTYLSHVSILDAWCNINRVYVLICHMRRSYTCHVTYSCDILVYVTLLIHVTFLHMLRYSFTHDSSDTTRVCLDVCDMSRHLYAWVMSRISIRHVTHRYTSRFQWETLRREAERMQKEF